MHTTRRSARGVLIALALVTLRTDVSAQTRLPDGRSLMAKFNAAIGGKAAFARLRSLHTTGAIISDAGVGQFETYAARPDRTLHTFNIDGEKTMQGFDGAVGWMLHPVAGPALLTGVRLAGAKAGADFNSMLRDPSQYTTIKTVGRHTIDGHDCYNVRLVSRIGIESFDCYAIDSGLLVYKMIRAKDGSESTTTMRRYKRVSGMMFPSEMVTSSNGHEQTMQYIKIEVNGVDPSVFTIPPAAKALLKK